MTKYAAYDEMSIYGIGDTAEAAIADARQEAREPEATFLTAKISDDLAAQIRAQGWNGNRQSFALRDGFIVVTIAD